MQENEFEKQVRQKVEGLKLNPSDSVWQNIEPHIKKEKRRSWALLLFSILACSIITYSIIQAILKKDKKQILTENTRVENQKFNDAKKEGDFTIISLPKAIAQLSSKNKNDRQQILSGENAESFISGNAKNIEEKKNSEFSKKNYENIEDNKMSTVAIIQNQDLNDLNVGVLFTNIIAKKELIKRDVAQRMAPANNNNTIGLKSKHPLVLGFYFTPGISTVNFNNGNGQKSFGYFSADAISIPGGYGYISPSKIKSSFAYIAGFSIDKYIFRKIAFNSGINFKHFATHNSVGQDSANFIRATSNIKNYHAQFNYIELPVGFKFQLTSFKKLNLFLNTGLSISYLLNTNALQFKNPPALYYHDNSMFQKVQAGLNAGIDLSYTTKQKRSVLFGPFINYSISQTATEGYYRHRFTFAGFRLQCTFTKKLK